MTGCLERVLVVSGSMNGLTDAGADTNSDSLTVSVAALEVTAVSYTHLTLPTNREV